MTVKEILGSKMVAAATSVEIRIEGCYNTWKTTRGDPALVRYEGMQVLAFACNYKQKWLRMEIAAS